MSISLGRGPIRCRPALVGCAVRIRVTSQPTVSIHIGSRLGRRRRRAPLEHVERKKMGASGDPNFHYAVVVGILDREAVLPVVEGQSAFCINHVCIIVRGNTRQRV